MRRSAGWPKSEFTALRYFTLDGSDYPSHAAQENAIAGYVRWRNKHAKPKRRFAIDSEPAGCGATFLLRAPPKPSGWPPQ
jgi:hypothetical protein